MTTMLNDQEFFQECTACDPSYVNIRDDEGCSEDKKFIEWLWRSYHSYADQHFRNDACTHFQQRFWEMYIGVTLITHGFKIDAGDATGPEFFIEGTPRIWVEAIAPGPGNGPDSVPELEYGKSVMTKVPSEEIILRLRHAILEKYRKYVQYLKTHIISPDEPYIIAINSHRIRRGMHSSSLPFIVQSVFPLHTFGLKLPLAAHSDL